MKALSIYAPYVDEICAGKKTEEYRTWQTKHRGDLLICSAARTSGWVWDARRGDYYLNWKGIYVVGHAMCVVSIDGCRQLKDGTYAWELSSLRLIDPVPVKGKQHMFEVDFEPDYLSFSTHAAALDYYAGKGLIDPRK